MEEKSKASEMLSQMKRYIHSDAPSQSVQPAVEESVPEVESNVVADNDAAIQINEEAPVSAENESQELEIEFVEPEPVVIETPKPAKPKVRKLPDDDALFEQSRCAPRRIDRAVLCYSSLLARPFALEADRERPALLFLGCRRSILFGLRIHNPRAPHAV